MAEQKGIHMRKKVEAALIELGVLANLSGFHYIVDAMEIYSEDETYITSKRTALHEKIAGIHNTTGSRVERAMRTAFEKAVTYGNLNSLNKYMTSAQKPTNGNLLACLYLKLR